ncbi:hypothetical protein EXIGLDRAFT_727349 [Exidia glandulosa HHB12029]|uniref:Uncharacterized protein n=1 Tax=Exidia glandulosa HHB12029 TaxID=1314781 RepID=A0A165M167_EXIGL|nr:hypothetical protein EXIGLDRAFT_727349 [Exidia glandulosa HHB12029]
MLISITLTLLHALLGGVLASIAVPREACTATAFDFIHFTPTSGAPVTILFILSDPQNTTCSASAVNPNHQVGGCEDGSSFQFLLNFNLTVDISGCGEVSGIPHPECSTDAAGETCVDEGPIVLSV